MADHLTTILIAIIAITYSLQFLADQWVFFYPALRSLKQGAGVLDYHIQKKLSFILRFLNVSIGPMVGLLVDLRVAPTTSVMTALSLMVIGAVSVALYLVFVLRILETKEKATNMSVGRNVKIGSLLYAFHFLGMPTAIYISALYPEYRATLIQLASTLNALSAIAQVFWVDNALSRSIHEGNRARTAAEVKSVLVYRTVSKIAAIFIFGMVMLVL